MKILPENIWGYFHKLTSSSQFHSKSQPQHLFLNCNDLLISLLPSTILPYCNPPCRQGKSSNVKSYHSSAQNTLVALDYSQLNLKSYCCQYALCGMTQLCFKFFCFCCSPFSLCFNHWSPCCSLTKAGGLALPPNLGNP